MALRKCTRCELNYILDDAPLCTVCRREVKGEQTNEGFFELCSVCNENPALPGKDMCLFCLKEMEVEKESGKDPAEVENPLALDDTSDMREIELDPQDDIPGTELGEIDRELSLDEVLAEEELEEEDESPEGDA